MIETKTLPLSKVKTVQDFKDAIGDSHLVMYTKFDYYNVLDARKSGTTWSRVYIIKVEKNQFKYYAPISHEISFMGDMYKCVHEGFAHLSTPYKNLEVVEQEFLELFLYNRKKKNTMYLTDSFMPSEIKEKGIALLNERGRLLNEALSLANSGVDNTHRHRGVYKAVPKNEVVIRSGDYKGITYVVGGTRHIFNFNYGEKYSSDVTDSYFNINGWARAARTFNHSNSDYSFLKISQKVVNEIHKNLTEAKSVQDEFINLISSWVKIQKFECK